MRHKIATERSQVNPDLAADPSLRHFGVGVLAQMLSRSARDSVQAEAIRRELHIRFGQAVKRIEEFLRAEG
jgi:hypothetical protein